MNEASGLSNLVFRGYNVEDWHTVAAICRAQKPEFNPLELPYLSDDYAHAELGKAPDNERTFGLVVELEGRLTGALTMRRGIGRMRHLGEIELFVVAPDAQGKGVGGGLLNAMINLSENWLNLTRLEHIIVVDNAPAIALHRKSGFIIEGKLRDYAYRNGRYVDAYLMARLRDA
ncbi:MAG: GNAT family N-acetyltransferase [Aggregatilineales bacterium]